MEDRPRCLKKSRRGGGRTIGFKGGGSTAFEVVIGFPSKELATWVSHWHQDFRRRDERTKRGVSSDMERAVILCHEHWPMFTEDSLCSLTCVCGHHCISLSNFSLLHQHGSQYGNWVGIRTVSTRW